MKRGTNTLVVLDDLFNPVPAWSHDLALAFTEWRNRFNLTRFVPERYDIGGCE